MPERLRSYLYTNPKSDPVAWIEKYVSLRHDPTSASDGLVRLEPYQKRPIIAQYQPETRQVTIMAVEQTGKSACWRFALLHKTVEYPAPRWIIYESDDKAAEINEEQFDPLLRHVPGLEGQINRRTSLKHRYNLPNGSMIDFSGAGSDITSKPKRDGVADELDTWPLTHDKIEQNLRNFKKRFRTFAARNEGCLVVVSSPSPRKTQQKTDLTRSVIDGEFEKSDHGYWTLRCQKCGKHTMPSHATHNLQWECEKDAAGKDAEIKPESLVLECPKCKHSHVQAQAWKMNEEGAYCNKRGEKIEGYGKHVGCQWGALACPRVFSWLAIAEAQMAAGGSASIYAQADYFNSWRGLAYRPKAREKAGASTIRKHAADMPDPADLANVFLAADTQDNGWYWVVRGVDGKNNLYLLQCGFARSIQDLKAAWDARYLDIMPVMGMIDEGGHGDMPKYARDLILQEKGLYGYKGGAFGEKWQHSKKVDKLILANAKGYQADLLYYIYSQHERSGCYWFLPPESDIGDEYLSHIAAIQPNSGSKHGNRLENWEPPDNKTADHYFDCEKMMLVLLDVAYKELKQWRKPVSNLRRGTPKKRRAPTLEL